MRSELFQVVLYYFPPVNYFIRKLSLRDSYVISRTSSKANSISSSSFLSGMHAATCKQRENPNTTCRTVWAVVSPDLTCFLAGFRCLCRDRFIIKFLLLSPWPVRAHISALNSSNCSFYCLVQ